MANRGTGLFAGTAAALYVLSASGDALGAERYNCAIFRSSPEPAVCNICTDTVSVHWGDAPGDYNPYGAELRSGECYPVFKFVFVTACDPGDGYDKNLRRCRR